MAAAVSPRAGDGDDFLENIGVAAELLPVELTSDEYLEMAVLGLQSSMPEFQEVNRSDFTFDGQPGKKLVFTYVINGTTFKDAFYEVVKGTKVYVIVGTAKASTYGDYKGYFDACAASFKFE